MWEVILNPSEALRSGVKNLDAIMKHFHMHRRRRRRSSPLQVSQRRRLHSAPASEGVSGEKLQDNLKELALRFYISL